MGVLIGRFLAYIIPLFAGMGVGKLLDKFASDKLPASVRPVDPFKNADGSIPWMRILFFGVMVAIGAMIVKFIGKKLNIKLLK